MTEVSRTIENVSKHIPWNKGKIVGAKPPLRPKHAGLFRTNLQVEGRLRDLALFNAAIDGELRGCDVVALKVDDIAASGYAADRAGIGARWYEVKLDQRSLPLLRPAALISSSRIANLETCWNGRTRLHDQMN